jgi:uncharacterized membrane protein YfcA
MVCCFVGYVIAGFTKSPWISLGLGIALVVIATFVLHKLSLKKAARAKDAQAKA